MACQDAKLAEVISVLNNALQVALLLVEGNSAKQHAGANAAQIRDAVFKAATAAHDLRLMTQAPSRGKAAARKVSAGAAVGAALGGILKGAKGALSGAAIGAGGATVYQLATQGRESTSRLNSKIELARAILWRFGSVNMATEGIRR